MFAFCDGNEKKWEPATGVFCRWIVNSLKIDPTEIFVGRCIRNERAIEEINEIKASLELAARQSPKVFANVTLALLLERRALRIDWSELKHVVPPQVVSVAGFLVFGEPSYDRALVEDLEQLSTRNISQTDLNFLFAPPSVRLPDLADVLLALANPVCPTLSQAIALAHAMKKPLTVITGPPGTGKTRIIVGLIIHQLLTGQSVFLASKINRAVDAAVELAERLLGEVFILRTGNEQEIEKLQERLKELLGCSEFERKGELFSGVQQLPHYTSNTADQKVQTVVAKANQIARQIQERLERLNELSRKLARFRLRPICTNHYGKRDLAKLFCSDCWSRWRWFLEWLMLLGERRWTKFKGEWKELLHQLENLHSEVLPQMRAELVFALWLKLNDLLKRGQNALENLHTALSDRRVRLKAFEQVAKLGFPIAVTNLSVGRNLPLETCFDTLIVDEASSCDPASLLPLLYCARRLVIVSDPQQLDYVTQERWRQVKPVPSLRSVDGEIFEANFGLSAYSLFESLIGGERMSNLAKAWASSLSGLSTRI
ncbi:MAG: AAA family ATPase [Armatimonadetes bacterium]|nr:AAA family ATPase [Armatimonadota bacterium]